eukprot:m.17383 g.17383  ORF g.17383 m.17383 type:complete len:590 (+) comp27479_c0_seq1:63-1832(+)
MRKGRPIGHGGEQPAAVPETLLKQARKSGQLNLSNRHLERVPENVWKLHEIRETTRKEVSLDMGADSDRWWEQADLTKFILASNRLTEIPEGIKQFPSLLVLDMHDNEIRVISPAIGELRELKRLNLSHNALEILVDEIGFLVNLTSLLLHYNQLKQLGNVLSQLTKLEELDISHNSLSSLPAETAGGLARLRQLNASHNALTGFPSSMSHLTAVQDLDLANNRLDTFPCVSGMKDLQRLNLQHNCLVQLTLMEGCSSLKELYLGNNKIKAVTAVWLQSLPALVVLDLRDNQIDGIPTEISQCTKLERLDLTNNDLTGLPYEMGNMTSLKSLTLAGNPLKKLRRDVVQKGTVAILKHLKSRIAEEKKPEERQETGLPGSHQAAMGKRLDYRNKMTASIPSDIFQSAVDAGVSEVDLSKNRLTALPDGLCQLQKTLTDLCLAQNRLSVLDGSIASFVKLTKLDLSANLLSDLPDLQPLTNLLELIISYNKFSSIPGCVYKVVKLETLLASDNHLCEINVDGLKNLKCLSSLDVQNNSIAHVPPELGTLKNLRALQLSGNSFRVPRVAILAKGTQAILEYLQDRMPTATST